MAGTTALPFFFFVFLVTTMTASYSVFAAFESRVDGGRTGGGGQQEAPHGTVLGHHGMVSATHPLAARAGVDMLEAGGNAFDAAIATAAAVGGDAFRPIHTAGDYSAAAGGGYHETAGDQTAAC